VLDDIELGKFALTDPARLTWGRACGGRRGHTGGVREIVERVAGYR
jgi:hypothetical protein